jgi:hypothetical protein
MVGMRFSLRWLFALTAYIAVVTAAVVTRSYLLADAVWSITWLAICYAIVIACVGKQQQRASAIGFVILAATNIAGLYLIPSRVPVMRIFAVCGYVVSTDGEIYEPDPARPFQLRFPPGLLAIVGTINAVGTLAIGLIGYFVGQLAYSGAYSAQQLHDPSD